MNIDKIYWSEYLMPPEKWYDCLAWSETAFKTLLLLPKYSVTSKESLVIHENKQW